MHKTTFNKMNWFKENYLNTDEKLSILDVGSLDNSGDNYNYGSIFDSPKWDYTGLDFVNGPNVDIVVEDIYNWMEIPDNSYDVVISGQLFEHLGFFWLTMGEIDRVLKPGGFCCIIAPSGGPKHGADTDCYRFQEGGMEFLAKYVDFKVLHISTNNSEEAKPWCDTCLVARKSGILTSESANLEQKINNLENKMNILINNINK